MGVLLLGVPGLPGVQEGTDLPAQLVLTRLQDGVPLGTRPDRFQERESRRELPSKLRPLTAQRSDDPVDEDHQRHDDGSANQHAFLALRQLHLLPILPLCVQHR